MKVKESLQTKLKATFSVSVSAAEAVWSSSFSTARRFRLLLLETNLEELVEGSGLGQLDSKSLLHQCY